jgi:mannitol/fructose-specific phosphotransferase system IIA component (Ntr-type)
MPNIKKIIMDADIVDLKARTKDDAIRELVETLGKRPQIGNPDEFLRSIIDREKIISTGIGIGLAMPHVKIASIKDFVLAIGRSPGGIDFEALDDQPVHIVAMIGANETQSGDFLKVLARLVLKLKDKAIRRKVLLAPNSDEVKKILLKDEET